MATIHEKLVDMLASVREMRQKLGKSPDLIDFISQNPGVAQSDLLAHFSKVSPRTLRRRLDALVSGGRIFREKKGREVVYKSA